MFQLWTNGKKVFKTEDKTKFYCQSLRTADLEHLEATLKTSKVLKASPASQDIFKKKCTLTCANSK